MLRLTWCDHLQVGGKWLSGAETVPTLYVFEGIELELSFRYTPTEDKEFVESDCICPIALHTGDMGYCFPFSV